MLDMFKKKLTVAVDTSAVTAELEALRTEFSQFQESAAQLATLNETLTQANAEQAGKIAELTAQLESLKEFAAAAEAEKARLVAEAEAARLAARKEKIVAAVGTDRADALMAATEKLDDAAFSAVVAALNVSAVVEAQTEMFTEVGADAPTDQTKVDEANKPVHFSKYMK